jgi:hypothetical protein
MFKLWELKAPEQSLRLQIRVTSRTRERTREVTAALARSGSAYKRATYRVGVVGPRGNPRNLPMRWLRHKKSPARGDLERDKQRAGLAARAYFNRYTEDAIDLCDVLSSFSSQNKASLHELCRVMGLPGKPDDMGGPDVERYCREGRLAEVAAYCETDVVNTYRVWLRYELFRGRLTENGLQASETNLSEYIQSRGEAKSHLAYVLVEEQKRTLGPDVRQGDSEIFIRDTPGV